WARTGAKERLSLAAIVSSPKFSGAGGLTLDSVVRFDWKVALGEQELSLKDLEELARLKAPLVRVRGQWVQVNAEEIRAAIDFWKEHGSTEGTARDAVRLALGANGTPAGLKVSKVEAKGWVEQLLQQLEGRSKFAE